MGNCEEEQVPWSSIFNLLRKQNKFVSILSLFFSIILSLDTITFPGKVEIGLYKFSLEVNKVIMKV